MKRIASGYYQETVNTTLDNQPITGLAEVVKVEGHPYWFVTIQVGSLMIMDGDSWLDTKADAVWSLQESCKRGFQRVDGLGICAK